MRPRLVAILMGLVACLPLTRAWSAPESGNACIDCHTFMGGDLAKPVSEWQGSIHQSQDITCDLCHGGNADLRLGNLQEASSTQLNSLAKQAMYSVSDFVGAPSGQAQFDVCANCHPDVVKTYSGSIMGKAYLQAKGGPSCTRCHGAHRNVIPSVPEVCKGCHQDTTGFAQLPAMNITDVQVQELARIRIHLGQEKVTGRGPLIKGHLESLGTGAVVWGMVLLLFLVSIGLHRLLKGGEKR